MSDAKSTSGSAFDAGFRPGDGLRAALPDRVLDDVRAHASRISGLASCALADGRHDGDDYALTGDERGLLVLTLVVIGLLVLEALVQFFQSYWTSWLGQAVTHDLRDTLYRKLMGFKLRWLRPHAHRHAGDPRDQRHRDHREHLRRGCWPSWAEVLKLVVVVVVMFVVNWKLALLSLLPIPVLLWATNIFKNSIRKSFQDVRTNVARLNAFVQEHIQGMSIVQAFGRERQEFGKFEAIMRSTGPRTSARCWPTASSSRWWRSSRPSPGPAGLVRGEGRALRSGQLRRPLRLHPLHQHAVPAHPAAGRPDSTCCRWAWWAASGVPGAGHRGRHHHEGTMGTEGLKGDIRFRGVWFAYEDEDFVLKDISFDVEAGRTIALVGATGSGKSSVINVLSRAYEFQKGEVLVDGRDIRSYALPELRRSIGVVLQDVFLFSDTIHNNITLHDPSISREQVVEAAKAVGRMPSSNACRTGTTPT